MKYNVILEPAEKGEYNVSVPALDGCFTKGEKEEECAVGPDPPQHGRGGLGRLVGAEGGEGRPSRRSRQQRSAPDVTQAARGPIFAG